MKLSKLLIGLAAVIAAILFISCSQVKDSEAPLGGETAPSYAPQPYVSGAASPAAPSGAVKEFTVKADGNSFEPYRIKVHKGDRVKITFLFSENRMEYKGLEIRSDYFRVNYHIGSDIKTRIVEFTADKTFTYKSYWLTSDIERASGTVEVV